MAAATEANTTFPEDPTVQDGFCSANCDVKPDFSGLPEVTWVKILSYLNIPQRNCVARTCQTLNTYFNNPSLWHTVQIILLGNLSKYSRGQGIIFPDRYVCMIERFGAYFQDLTLIFHGYLHGIPEGCEQVITRLAQTCRLAKLTLSVGCVTSKRDFYYVRPRKIDLDVLVSLVTNAFRLHSFTLQSWPMYRGIHIVNILKALMSNAKIKNLEELSLYWLSAEKATWATLNAMVPKPEEMVETMRHFTNVKRLRLRSTMLNEAFIKELALHNHTPLEELSILVTYSRHENDGGIPDISCTAWKQLCEHAPDLMVHITFVTRVPYFELAALLKPEVPVASIAFMKYSKCDSQDLESITDKYSKTLRKFVCYATGEGLDDDLIRMVSKSTLLNYFIYHGTLHHTTVLALASVRATNWNKFLVMKDNIITDEFPVNPEDEDEVIVQGEDGQYVIKGIKTWHKDEEERKLVLTEMTQQVSGIVQHKWSPAERITVDEELDSP